MMIEYEEKQQKPQRQEVFSLNKDQKRRIKNNSVKFTQNM